MWNYNMWKYRQYYLRNLIVDNFYPLGDRFFLSGFDSTYGCSASAYNKIERVANTKVMRALLC